ncbi:MAG: sulfotransferase [Vicingaceae bacterium]
MKRLFIVGVAKGGTTALSNYLDQHPDICFSPIKEPHYFSTDIKVEDFRPDYKNAVKSNSKHRAYIRDEKEYQDLFANCGEVKYLGEASPSYLCSSVAAQNIYNYDSTSRIIVVLRNPMERAFSHYLMNLRMGYKDISFMKAVEEDFNAPNKGWGISHLLIELGFYHIQIDRYFKVFPREQIKIVIYEHFKQRTLDALEELTDFLGLSEYQYRLEDQYNVAKLPKSRGLYQLVRKLNLAAYTPEVVKKRFSSFFYKGQEELPKLSLEDKKILYEKYYRKEIEKVEELLDLDLTAWHVKV